MSLAPGIPGARTGTGTVKKRGAHLPGAVSLGRCLLSQLELWAVRDPREGVRGSWRLSEGAPVPGPSSMDERCQVRGVQSWLGLSWPRAEGWCPARRHSHHWGFSPSMVLASSLVGTGDFLGEAAEPGLEVPGPGWVSMLACSFRTRSSSSFCGARVVQVRGHMGQKQGPYTGLEGAGVTQLLTFHPRRSASARQPWSQSPSQATSLQCG